MLKKILFLLLVFISQNAFTQSKDEKVILKDKEAILKLLSAQVEFWNKGDVNQFMHGYWENDSLVFVGKDGVTYGYGTTKPCSSCLRSQRRYAMNPYAPRSSL